VVARRQIEALAGELKQAVKARDEFLAIASHELRTPLTPLMLQSQLLRRDIDAGNRPKLRDRADLIERSVAKLGELTHTMLDVSRITATRLDLTLVEIDLVQLAGEVIERLRPSLDASGSMLTTIAPAPVSGSWDRLRLEQILANLISNAIKYGRGNPISIAVATTRGAAVLRVEDRGIGIAPADQVRIFERFERAVPSRHYGGFGLGLWIARQLVEAMGGTIRVDSKLDQGATFTVTLPLHS
jgi:signal transduction histidine kinase